MDINTFYYTLSTIPQVVAAIGAILAVFLFRRFESLENHLIGDGKSVYDRSEAGEYDFLFNLNLNEKNKQDLRLRDGISRKNIIEIKKVIEFYKDQEKQAEDTGIPINKDTGFKYLYDKFCETESKLNNLKRLSKYAFVVSILSIFFSVICLTFSDWIFLNCLSYSLLISNLIVFIIAISLTVCVVTTSFKKDTLHKS